MNHCVILYWDIGFLNFEYRHARASNFLSEGHLTPNDFKLVSYFEIIIFLYDSKLSILIYNYSCFHTR